MLPSDVQCEHAAAPPAVCEWLLINTWAGARQDAKALPHDERPRRAGCGPGGDGGAGGLDGRPDIRAHDQQGRAGRAHHAGGLPAARTAGAAPAARAPGAQRGSAKPPHAAPQPTDHAPAYALEQLHRNYAPGLPLANQSAAFGVALGEFRETHGPALLELRVGSLEVLTAQPALLAARRQVRGSGRINYVLPVDSPASESLPTVLRPNRTDPGRSRRTG